MVYKDGIFNVMDKAFSIAIDSRTRILKQCNGVANETPFPFFTKMEARGGFFTFSSLFSLFSLCRQSDGQSDVQSEQTKRIRPPPRSLYVSTILISIVLIGVGAREAKASPSAMPPKYNLLTHSYMNGIDV